MRDNAIIKLTLRYSLDIRVQSFNVILDSLTSPLIIHYLCNFKTRLKIDFENALETLQISKLPFGKVSLWLFLVAPNWKVFRDAEA